MENSLAAVALRGSVPVVTDAAAAWRVERWLPALEVVRGIAAFAVVIHHAVQEVWGPTGSTGLLFAHWLGAWGVALFFVLSGFCIHLPRARAFHERGEAGFHVGQFVRQRARRLLPPHYAALVLSCVAAIYLDGKLLSRPTVGNVLAHVFMVHVWSGAFYSVNAVFWSIAVEVHFYFAYPLYLRLLRRFGPMRLTVALLTLGLAFYGAGSLVVRTPGPARLAVQSFFLVTWWQWSLGACLAEVYVRARETLLSRIARARGAALAAFTSSLALAFVDPAPAGLHVRYWILPVACWLGLAALVLGGAGWLSRSRPLASLGRVSYSLYLVHPIAVAGVTRILAPISAIGAAAGAICVALLLGYAFFLAFERPLLKPAAVSRP